MGKTRPPYPAEFRVDLLGGFLPDVAGVEDHEVRIVHRLGHVVTGRRERFGHALGIIRIHLAAEGLDVELFAALGHALL